MLPKKRKPLCFKHRAGYLHQNFAWHHRSHQGRNVLCSYTPKTPRAMVASAQVRHFMCKKPFLSGIRGAWGSGRVPRLPVTWVGICPAALRVLLASPVFATSVGAWIFPQPEVCCRGL